MLPTEAFADVVSFLGYYDLGGLKLTSKPLSAITNRCAAAIRLFDFTDFAFCAYDRGVDVYRLETDGRRSWICHLELSSEKSYAEFIAEAFRNCTVGRFYLLTRHEHVLNAIRAVAETVTVADKLYFPVGFFESTQDLIEFVDSFRRVKVWAS